MLIALLAVLGFDLWVIVTVLAVLLTRKRWVTRQPGAFKGAIRVTEGDVHGLRAKWQRGYGRWVRDILIWTKTPFLFRNELVLADALADQARDAKPGEVRRLGSIQPSYRCELTVARGSRLPLRRTGGNGRLDRSPKAPQARTS